MAHLSGTERSQLLLLPESLDDYVGPDNSVGFIEAFVDGLNIAPAGFDRVTAKETGRLGFDPADLRKPDKQKNVCRTATCRVRRAVFNSAVQAGRVIRKRRALALDPTSNLSDVRY
jgi:hypothetical protein